MKILAVGISVRAMVESAANSNYRIIGLDAFGDQDLKSLVEGYSLSRDFHAAYSAEALFRAAGRLKFDAIAYTSNLENHPEILKKFAAGHTVIGNAPEVVESVRNWAGLSARLQEAGFAVPESVYKVDGKKLPAGRRWLLKPTLSGGGCGIVFFKEDGLPDGHFMLQEYIPGKSCSASFIAAGRKCVVLGITQQLVGLRAFGSRDFRYIGNILPLPEAVRSGIGKDILMQVRLLAEFLTREYGLVGLNGIDFILQGGRIYATEINPRYSASMELMELGYGLPMFHLHTQAVLNGKLPDFDAETTLKSKEFFGKAILFAEKDAVAPDTKNWHSRALRDIPAGGQKLAKGAPVCTILARGAGYEEVQAELVRMAGILKKEIYGS